MVNLFPTIRLAQLILKCKFSSKQQQQHFISPHNIQEIKIHNNSTDDDKPLRIKAPQKGPLKNVSPGAYFLNFTVFESSDLNKC